MVRRKERALFAGHPSARLPLALLMDHRWIEVAGCSVTQAQVRVLRAISEAAYTPKIGDYHRATEIRLEKRGLIRRVAYEPGTRVAGWLVAKKGWRVLEALARDDALPRAAEALGRAYERTADRRG